MTEVEILVNGKPVKKYSHNGRTYIEAKKGSSYSIRIKNDSSLRQMFVVSVDGINVVDGKAAGSSKTGYVLSGYSSYEVSGFRTSNEEVHPFKFNDKAKSYAAKSEETDGDVSNCGVIGVQIYSEKITLQQQITQIKEIHHHHWPKPTPKPSNPWRKPWPTYPDPYIGDPIYDDNTWTLTSTSAGNSTYQTKGQQVNSINSVDNGMLRCMNFVSTTSMDAETCSDAVPFSAGTEFSKEAVTSKVTDTTFDIGLLLATIEIFYDYRDGLVKQGVPVTKEVKVAMPQAFPARFCKPPKD